MIECGYAAGFCTAASAVYVFGQMPQNEGVEGRMTMVAGPRGRWLAERNPSGARCLDHALAEFEDAVETMPRSA